MDFLNRAYAQFLDWRRATTPGGRLTAGLLTACLLFAAGYLCLHPDSTPDVDLMHGVPVAAADLPPMEAAFAKANLKGYDIRGTSIRVPRGQEAVYMAALADAKALPPNIGDALGVAISSGTAFESSRQRDDRMRIARQAELSLIIRSMNGIESAYVLYDVDGKTGTFNRDKLITATASVKPAGSSQLDEARVSAIRHLVAGAIAGLKPENVTVSDRNGRTWHGQLDSAAAGQQNVLLALQRTCEQDLKAKILGALCFIPNVTVEPTVAFDRERATHAGQPERSTNARRRRDGNDPANARPAESRPERSAPVAGQPNTATILNGLLGAARGKDDVAEPDAADAAKCDRAETESLGLTPTLARVSVGVPISYFKKVWQERNPVEAGQAPKTPDPAALDQIRIEESAKIQRHVAQLLPSAESTTKTADLVTVTAFQDIPTQEPPAPSPGENLLSWLRQSWGTLASIAAAMVGLLVLRSMLRRTPANANPPHADPDADLDRNAAGEKPSAAPPPHARRFYDPGPALRDELSELVGDDPDAAANVLRTWIGHSDHLPLGK